MSEPIEPDWNELVSAAIAARKRAYAPYSGFAVGAALLDREGRIHVGCNVENRSFGMTICAERTAVVSAVASTGRAELVAAVVVADSKRPPRPCGLCLDTLAEFAGPELKVRLANLAGETEDFRLGDLLPHPFSADDLERRP